MDTARFFPLMSWWENATEESGPKPAFASLCVQLARKSDRETAKFLARQALDFAPGSYEALEVLERLTFPGDDRKELLPRYEAFLQNVPFHQKSPQVREKLIDALTETGQYDAAMQHVHTLTRLTQLIAPEEESSRACRVPLPEPSDSISELEPFEIDAAVEALDIEIDVGE
jgi:hypothetical protein